MKNKLLKKLIFVIIFLTSSYAYSSINLSLEKAMVNASSTERLTTDYSNFLNLNFKNLKVSIDANADEEKVMHELELLEKIMNGDISAKGVQLEFVECTHPACIFSSETSDNGAYDSRPVDIY